MAQETDTGRRRCPDDGVCHHSCDAECFRVGTCVPLTGVYPDDRWPDNVESAGSAADAAQRLAGEFEMTWREQVHVEAVLNRLGSLGVGLPDAVDVLGDLLGNREVEAPVLDGAEERREAAARALFGHAAVEGDDDTRWEDLDPSVQDDYRARAAAVAAVYEPALAAKGVPPA